jgi:inosine/xanthosine triphosphatase
MRSAVAGTFNVLHEGHRMLIDRAFEVGDDVFIGITSDDMAEASRSMVNPINIRRAALVEYLSTKDRPWIVFEIEDMYGPREFMDAVDVLVVSDETLDNGVALNSERAARGLAPLELSVVPLVLCPNGGKICSTAIMTGEYGRNGDPDTIDIAVGSTNRVKVEAVRSVMERIYGDVRITAVDVPSGVPEQPFEEQTRMGAENRARRALGDHDMAVGIEAGVFERDEGLYDIQHCVIVDADGFLTSGMGSGFRYPDEVAEKVRGGMTVGEAMDSIYGSTDIGHREGAIGLLSKGLLDRKTLTEQSVTAAMIPRIWDR